MLKAAWDKYLQWRRQKKTEEVQFNLLATFTLQFNTTDHW